LLQLPQVHATSDSILHELKLCSAQRFNFPYLFF